MRVEMGVDALRRQSVKLSFSDGDWNVVIPPDVLRRADHLQEGSLCSAFERIYSELVEDHYVERDLRAMQQQLVHAARYHTDPDQLREMQENLRVTEEHVRQHHRHRRDYARAAIMPRRRVSSVFPEEVNIEPLTFVDLDLPPPPPGPDLDEARRLLNEMADRLTREAFFGGGATTARGGNGGGSITPESLREAYEIVRGGSGAAARSDAGVRGGDGAGVYVTEHYWQFPGGVRTIEVGGGGYSSSDIGTKEAQERGMALLKDNLTPAQLHQYEAYKHFEVIGCDTGTRYRIRHGRQMNIDVLNKYGNRNHGICFLPTGNLVAGDCMIDQKIALETMESEALRIANRFP